MTSRVAQIYANVFFFFFFSSRRRHTRSDRDWSSDVCSSDLSINPDREPMFATASQPEAVPAAPAPRARDSPAQDRPTVHLPEARSIRAKQTDRKSVV